MSGIIATIVGARPQFIKAAIVTRALREQGFREALVHTGQHYDVKMSDVFFEELAPSRPEYHLDIGSASHGAQTGRMLEACEALLQRLAPSCVLVYGDTNSTIAGALAAAKLHIPVVHVEAGLRSFNRRMPEEINRVLTDHLSELLFAPTETAVTNLRREGLPDERIRLVGDVMYDAALYFRSLAAGRPILGSLGLAPKKFVLATVHRAENTDVPERLRIIFDGLVATAARMPVVWPVHPRTRVVLDRLSMPFGRIKLIAPVGYLDMVALESAAAVIATDSGGVQKEAFFHKVPCVTLRDETEWTELLELGWNRLAPPTDAERIATAIRDAETATGAAADPYGGGQASLRIARELQERWG